MAKKQDPELERITELSKMAQITNNPSLPNESALELSVKFIKNRQSIVLYGPPGTGKTRIAELLKQKLQEEKILGLTVQVQFHKEFSYEDFIEGYIPDSSGHYSIRDGILKLFCSKIAKEKNQTKLHLLFIDEINRADISAVFGEALYLLEDRAGRKLTTAHSQNSISIPENLVIVGTMNTADRNIAIIDFALRRRFIFIPVFPDYKELQSWLNIRGFAFKDFSSEEYVKAATTLNARILTSSLMGKNMQLGQSMFVPKSSSNKQITLQDITEVFNFIIFPQLESYTGFGYEEELSKILSPSITSYLKTGAAVPQEQVTGFIKSLLQDKQVTNE